MPINALTEKTLTQQVNLWQRFFRLQDWEIKAKIVDDDYFDDPDQIGGCNFWIEERSAVIAIANEELGNRIIEKNKRELFYDMQKTLLHEMLHVFLAPLEADDANIFLEQRINLMADRLVDCLWLIESMFKAEISISEAEPAVRLAPVAEVAEAVAA